MSCPASLTASGRCAEEREDGRTSRPADGQTSPGQKKDKRAATRSGAANKAEAAQLADWRAVMRRRQGITDARKELYWHGTHEAAHEAASGPAEPGPSDPEYPTDEDDELDFDGYLSDPSDDGSSDART